ncbi:DUF4386 domain-containing protein [Flagellimonas myxillae]|uniref:DUF4386 domain-containing protein n=1 Tax=Flagellimonas myxillae TaxID=2942214 RepID=UPI00201F96FF|nr:DUF4386 domain-containing protein [Muricauda myxillae]MCL6265571.1 DUF4386 domain-containing protein [Muricauda myxillae]
MKSNQKIGRIVGITLLLIMALGIPSLGLRGLSYSLYMEPDFLKLVHENAARTRIAIVLDILASALWVFIACLLFPKIKSFKPSLALAFFGLWVVNFGVSIYGNISNLSLLSLAESFVKKNGMAQEMLNTLGFLKIEDYYWSHFMALITYASAAFVLYYFLFRTKLVPRWLSAWGMTAISLVFFASWANIFEMDISFHFYSQNGIHMIAFMGWLIAKGFSSPKGLER